MSLIPVPSSGATGQAQRLGIRLGEPTPRRAKGGVLQSSQTVKEARDEYARGEVRRDTVDDLICEIAR